MIHRSPAFRSALAATAAVCLPAWLAAGQAPRKLAPPDATRKTAPSKPALPRGPAGHPDLSGIWSFATVTPLERPVELGNKAVLTDEEAAAFEKQIIAREDKDSRDGGAEADVSRAYNDFWWDRGSELKNGTDDPVFGPILPDRLCSERANGDSSS